MESKDSNLDEIYERLSAAIMNSITTSKDVKAIMQELSSQGLINEAAVFNLLLSLEELDAHINPKPFTEDIYKLEPGMETRRPKTVLEFGYLPQDNTAPKIDGKALSEREKLFEDYCQASFDEEAWLKRAKLKM